MNKSLTETISQSLCAYLVSMLTSSIATRSTLPLLLSFVQTVSPNPILCISGWNLIWITDCPHSILQLSLSDLCVHKRSFVFTECALVSMVMPLHYAYAKNNSNSNTVCNKDVLPLRLRCSIIFCLVKQRQTCRKLEYAALFRAAVSAIFLFYFFFIYFFVSATFKTQRGACTSGILFFPAWLALRNDTSLFLQRCSACFLQKHLTCLRFTWREDVKKQR